MIEPRLDNVLIKELKDEKSKGGIILPGNREERATKGEIMAIGPGKIEDGEFRATSLKPGQVVVFHSFPTGLEVHDGNEKYKLIQEKQILAVLR